MDDILYVIFEQCRMLFQFKPNKEVNIINNKEQYIIKQIHDNFKIKANSNFISSHKPLPKVRPKSFVNLPVQLLFFVRHRILIHHSAHIHSHQCTQFQLQFRREVLYFSRNRVSLHPCSKCQHLPHTHIPLGRILYHNKFCNKFLQLKCK